MGLVISTGLSIGTLFTLFVVPAMYLFIGANHSKNREAEVGAPAPAPAPTPPLLTDDTAARPHPAA